MDRIPQKYQEMKTLGIRTRGAGGDEKALPIERMGGIVNGYDLWIVSECVVDRGSKLSNPLTRSRTGGS